MNHSEIELKLRKGVMNHSEIELKLRRCLNRAFIYSRDLYKLKPTPELSIVIQKLFEAKRWAEDYDVMEDDRIFP